MYGDEIFETKQIPDRFAIYDYKTTNNVENGSSTRNSVRGHPTFYKTSPARSKGWPREEFSWHADAG